jgi:uncharacterized GH25 family protein
MRVAADDSNESPYLQIPATKTTEEEKAVAWARYCLIISILLGVLASDAHAHHLWVVKTGDDYVIARGMAPKRIDPYDPACVKEFLALDSAGAMVAPERIQRIDGADQVRFRTGEEVSMVAVRCDWGYRVNTTKGKKLVTRQEAEKAGFRVISAFFSTQYAKVLFKDGRGNTRSVGLRFELVPLEDPHSIDAGGVLPFQAFFDGKPMVGISVFSEDGKEWKTDTAGIGHVRLSGEGLHLYMARHKVPVQGDPNREYHLFTTFLVFEVE